MKGLRKKILSVLLALLMMVSVLPAGIIPAQAAGFTPRLTAPEKTGYYKDFYCNNCTRYAAFRINEILGSNVISVPTGGVGISTIETTLKNRGFKVGTTPKLGAVAINSHHISVVEKMDSTGTYVSESHLAYPYGKGAYDSDLGKSYQNTVRQGPKNSLYYKSGTYGSGYGTYFTLHKINSGEYSKYIYLVDNPIVKNGGGNDTSYASGNMQRAIDWAIATAYDPKCGYSQEVRTGPDYDCSSFVGHALYYGGFTSAGTSIKTMSTADECAYLEKLGFKDVTSSVNFSTGKGLQKGDILWKRVGLNGHTEIYIGDGKLAGARHSTVACKSGCKVFKPGHYGHRACGEKAGDQGATAQNPIGTEIVVDNYRNSSWMKVYRCQSYKATADNPTNITNNSAKITVSLNAQAKIQAWGYFIGTKESEVKNVDANDSNNRKDTKTMDYVMGKWFSTQITDQKKFSKDVTKFLGDPLKANTTYYYKMFIKVGANWLTTDVKKFTTKNDKPGSTTATVSAEYENVGIGDSSVIQWAKAGYADSYTVEVYNSNGVKVFSKKNTTDTSVGVPADSISKADTYSIKLYANNKMGTTTCKVASTITVHDDVTVTFVDHVDDEDIEDEIIEKRTIPYGHNVDAPENPSKTGFTFSSWDKSTKSIKSDCNINTIYTRNKYKVTFINGLNGAMIGKPQTVEYKRAATEPNPVEMDGYDFAGWDKSFDCITEDTQVIANYNWYDNDYPVKASVTGITKKTKSTNNVTGYEVEINVQNYYKDDTEGRFVVALKSQSNLLLAETESLAFSLNPSESKKIVVFVPYSDLAYKASIYCVNNYGHTGTLCKSFDVVIDNSNNWSDWYAYTGIVPVTKGVNYVSDVDLKVETSKATEYRYSDKVTTTSYNTSLSGYTQDGGKWVSQGATTLNYASNGFNAGFDKNNALYKKYNVSKKSNSENATTKVVVNSDALKGYVYWHWCRGGSYGAINRGIEWNKTGSYTTFHAFESTEKKAYKPSPYNSYQFQKTSACNDSYWWFGRTSGTDGLTTIKTQKYTTYKKLFNYYKWSEWSEWSGTPQTASATRQVQTRQVDAGSTNYYRYKTTQPVVDPNVDQNRIVNINETVSKDFAGKEANVYIYKYTQTADYTNEYISDTIVIGENGEINIKGAKLREAPTAISGDYTVVVSIKGCTEAIEIGKILAPKPEYTVKFYDTDRKTVISETKVEAGSIATAPTADKLTIQEGYGFVNWDQSVVNVNDDLDVYPVCEKETYVVTFIDWNSQKATMEERQYGDEVNPPELESMEGIVSNWDLSSAKKVEVTNEDGTVEEKYVIVENTIITTNIAFEHYHSTFLKDVKPNTNISDIEIPEINEGEELENTDDTTIGDNVDPLPDFEGPEYIFRGWRSLTTGKYLEDTEVTESDVYYPVYEFSSTTENPVADVESGEFNSEITVTLSCETEEAVIYYTTDNSNPATSATAIEYTEPITLTKSTALRFCAMTFGMNNSENMMEVYAINTSTSGVKYHLVTVFANLPYADTRYYQALLKEDKLLDVAPFQNVEGCTLDGFYFDEDYTDEFFIEDEGIADETILYAHYTMNEYTAKFVDDNGTILDVQKVNYLESAEPPVPTKDGYIFIGWDSDSYKEMKADATYTAKYCSYEEYATISLNRNKVSTCVGRTFSGLRVTAKNLLGEIIQDDVEWDSSDWSIASVDADGKVYPLSNGTVTITATSTTSGESAECVFTINQSTDTSVIIAKGSYLTSVPESNCVRGVLNNNTNVENIKTQFINDNLTFFNFDGEKLKEQSSIVTTGTTISIIDEENEGITVDFRTLVVVGDVNCDGVINNRDTAMVNQFLVEKKELGYCQELACDVNGDGYVNNRDAAMIARYLVGKETLK